MIFTKIPIYPPRKSMSVISFEYPPAKKSRSDEDKDVEESDPARTRRAKEKIVDEAITSSLKYRREIEKVVLPNITFTRADEPLWKRFTNSLNVKNNTQDINDTCVINPVTLMCVKNPAYRLNYNVYDSETLEQIRKGNKKDPVTNLRVSDEAWNSLNNNDPVVLHGHSESVNSLAFSPDGATLVTASGDGNAILWNLNDNSIVKIFSNKEWINSVAFSSDGRKIATGGVEKTAVLWNLTTGKRGPYYSGHFRGVESIAFSPDGTKLATGSADASAILWNVNAGQIIHVLANHRSAVMSVAFSPDGIKLATASLDGKAKLWNVATGAQIATFEVSIPVYVAEPPSLRTVTFSPDGLILATGNDDGTIRIWNTMSGQTVSTIEAHNNRVTTVAFSPDGLQLASGSTDKSVKLWVVGTRRPIKTYTEHDAAVTCVAFSPDGLTLATASGDKTAIIRPVI